MKKLLKNKKGFTLMEMLIVVAIIVILVAVSFPIVASQLDEAKEAADAANLRSAKAVASVEYLMNSTAVDGMYYDVATGDLVSTKPTGYGQSNAYEDKVIKITLTNDTIDAVWE